MSWVPFSPMMVPTGRTDHASVIGCDNDRSDYTPFPRSSMTFLRLRHRNGEATSSTLYRGLGGGKPRGRAPMLSKQEFHIIGGMLGGGRSAVRRRLEVGVGRPATVNRLLICLISFEITIVTGVFSAVLL